MNRPTIRRIWLERVLPKRGLCSRTEARRWIREGRVRVGGRVVTDPRTEVDEVRARLEIAGRRADPESPRYLMLHKPAGCLTTARDERGRPTVFDLLGRDLPYLFPIGRLDQDSSGLLLLTNDSRFAERIADPKHHVPKRYRVVTRARLSDAQVEALRRGVILKDGPTRPARVTRPEAAAGSAVLSITLTEGRNRQVRRMVEAVGDAVVRLEREAIGPLRLGRLAAGAWRDLTAAEVKSLLAASR